TTLQEPLEWNATLLEGDVAEAVANVKEHRGGRPHRHCGLLPADQCVSERRARVDDAASGTNAPDESAGDRRCSPASGRRRVLAQRCASVVRAPEGSRPSSGPTAWRERS